LVYTLGCFFHFLIISADIHDYAKILGIDPEKEKELLWIAKEGFSAVLPKEWRAW
jgi:centrosomal protein CEP164